MDPSVGEQREAIQHGDGQDLQGMLHPGLLQDRGHLEEVRSDHFLLEVREQTQTIHGTKHSYLQVMFMGYIPYPNAPWDCHICRLDPPKPPPLAVSRHLWQSQTGRV